MSSRALRKIHGEEALVVPGSGSSSDGEEAAAAPQKSKSNLFSLLGDDSGVEEGEEPAETPDTKPPPEEAKQGAKKKKKKRKKKGGGGSGGNAQQNGPAVKENPKKSADDEEDEIDRGVREADEILGPAGLSVSKASSSSTASSSQKPLLFVEHKHLNPDNEMKKIFGSHVVKNDMRQRKRNQRHQRSTWLTIPKPSWPPMSKQGLSMQRLPTQGQYNHFTFQHSKEYQQVQFQFLDAVESHNPTNIMELARLFPYHVDSLLQLSEISRMSEDTAMAVELIERALYACESAFHPLLNMTQANCRLDYKRPENRCLFIALFKHIRYVGMRGCNRTALELSKLLLSFDPDGDHLGALLMLDYYALKSEQYSFLKRLYDEWEAHKNLSQLPNHAFSAALTYYHLSVQGTESMERADEMLKTALTMFPLVLLPLLEKCSIQPDAEVSAHPVFAASTGEPPALSQLVSLFVARNYALWKEPEVAIWMERNVRELMASQPTQESSIKENKEKRQSRFRHAPRNIYRHIILSDIEGVTVSLPPDLANVPVMAFDPLPPKDSIVSYTRPTRRPAAAPNNSWMSEFFRSMMPSYTPPPPGQAVDLDQLMNEDEGAVGGYLADDTDLRRGINDLMASMRDLLNVLQPTEEEQQEMDEVD